MPRNIVDDMDMLGGITFKENAELKAAMDGRVVSEYLEKQPDASEADILIHVGMKLEWVNCHKKVIKFTLEALAQLFSTRQIASKSETGSAASG